MSDERGPAEHERDEPMPSLEGIARLDAYLDRLVGEQRPADAALSVQEAREQMLAAQLRLLREGVEAPTPAFLQALEGRVAQAIAPTAGRPRPGGLSRGRFLRTAATLAGGAGLGAAGAEGAAAMREAGRPHDLIVAGNERWYAIATVGEVAPGGAKPFEAGGLSGYLFNSDGRLHAVSAICTHMGCRLKLADPAGAPTELRCLCHGSRFNRRGGVERGLAPSPLPAITVRVENGRVYALGTRESV